MKKYFLLFALILIFSVPACGKKSENQATPEQNDADETADTNDDNSGKQTSGDPCENNPCEGLPHSTENCEIFYDYRSITPRSYKCECEKGWFWNGNEKKCLNPCENEPCKNITNAIECIGETSVSFSCKCEDGYFFLQGKCLKNPCKSSPCGNPNFLKECIPQSETTFRCICKNGYFWNGDECTEIPECTPTSPAPCKDSSSGLIWSSKISCGWKEGRRACLDLSEGGFDDWKYTGISKVRTLIKDCSATQTGGECEVSEYCKTDTCSNEYCIGCEESNSGYSKLGDTGLLLSDDENNDLCFWAVNFNSAAIEIACGKQYDRKNIRCARCIEPEYWWDGEKCVKNPCDSKSCADIPHADPWFSCEPKQENIYFCLCEDGYKWNGKNEECVPD